MLMYKLGLPQERQLTTPRLVDDHPRPEFSHPEVRGCPPQDQQMTDHPSRPPAKALVAKGLSTGKRDSFHCLILRHFSIRTLALTALISNLFLPSVAEHLMI